MLTIMDKDSSNARMNGDSIYFTLYGLRLLFHRFLLPCKCAGYTDQVVVEVTSSGSEEIL